MVRNFRSFISSSLLHKQPIEDGLLSLHVTDCLSHPRFRAAYDAGKKTGSWNDAELRWRVYTCCWAAEHALSVDGDFIECGVNRGGMARAVTEYVGFSSLPRTFYLFDTFCGDSDVAEVNQHDYRECYEDVQKTFASFPNVRLIRGRIPGTLPEVKPKAVAFLSIDLNNALPEVAALRYFWHLLSVGAVVILDDYAYSPDYKTQKDAIDNLAAELRFSVFTLPTGQGMIIKGGHS